MRLQRIASIYRLLCFYASRDDSGKDSPPHFLYFEMKDLDDVMTYSENQLMVFTSATTVPLAIVMW
jgi:hypothetical protein